MEEEYYIWYTYGVSEGPYSLEKINELIKEGRLREEDKVWIDRYGEWKKANELEELIPLFQEQKERVSLHLRMRKKIMCIDDDWDLREILKNVLEEKNYTVITAEDGLEGLRKVYLELPDLIILDIMIPRLNGLELCRRLKKDTQMKNIPILFLSAKDQNTDKLLGLESGGEVYLTKPFEVEDLLSKVESLLRTG